MRERRRQDNPLWVTVPHSPYVYSTVLGILDSHYTVYTVNILYCNGHIDSHYTEYTVYSTVLGILGILSILYTPLWGNVLQCKYSKNENVITFGGRASVGPFHEAFPFKYIEAPPWKYIGGSIVRYTEVHFSTLM